MSAYAILRALAERPMTTRQAQAHFSASLAKPVTAAVILRLQAEGKVAALKGGLWQPTALGIAMLPVAQPEREWGQYIPPRVIRRAGSDRASKLPSVAAGRRVWPRDAR